MARLGLTLAAGPPERGQRAGAGGGRRQGLVRLALADAQSGPAAAGEARNVEGVPQMAACAGSLELPGRRRILRKSLEQSAEVSDGSRLHPVSERKR